LFFRRERRNKGESQSATGPAKNVKVEVLTSKKEPVKKQAPTRMAAYSVDGLKGGLYILRCNTKETGLHKCAFPGKIVDADISVPFAVVEKGHTDGGRD